MEFDFGIKTRSAAVIAAANATTGRSKTTSEENMSGKAKEAKSRKVIGTDHHGNEVFEGRQVVGKDDYGRDVFDGQVEIKDGHGKKVFQEPWVGKGPKAGPDNPEGKDEGDDE
jgi:hypothetical protein